MSRVAVLLLVVSLMTIASTGEAHAQTAGAVQATDLGPGQALGINDRGLIIGVTPNVQSPTSAWLYRKGERTELGTLGGEQTVPRAISQAGQVVGRSQNAQGDWRAFLRHNDGRMIDLGTLGGTQSEATAINRRGEVVGWSEDGTGRRRAFVWRNGRMEDLGGPEGGSSTALGINKLGQVVGSATPDGELQRSVLWERDGQIVDLHAYFPFQDLPSPSSRAVDINDVGQIVGDGYMGEGFGYRLDALDRGSFTWLWAGYAPFLTAINNEGIAVGCGADEYDGCHAHQWGFDSLWLPCLQEVHAPGGCGADDINDKGQVVGWSRIGTWEAHEHRAVLWELPRR